MIRLLKRLALALCLVVFGLLAPIGYVELACRPTGDTAHYASFLESEHHRPEGRTLLTYPEWHIVHAYDDYAETIRTGDPHDYGYVSAVAGFWSSLCSLSAASGPHGGFPSSFKSTVYVIGVSFTAELFAKGLYEETIGRAATWARGETRAPLDELSAQQAKQYSKFLRQVPWYQWDFTTDAVALDNEATSVFRDRERRFALGLEYGAKARYAGVIAAAVATVEPDELRLRMIINGLGADDLATYDGVEIIAERAQGIEIDTPRYRELTNLLMQMAQDGGDFVEIAGNDDILFSATSAQPEFDGAFYSFARQGYEDTRHLILLPVAELSNALREIEEGDLKLEHIHDY